MSKGRRWLLVVVGGLGYQGLISAAYVVTLNYALFQSSTGFSDTQMGVIGSIVGSVALVGYLFGGILSDYINSKTLLLISHLVTPFILIYMSTLPSYRMVLICQFVLGICSVFTYWSPMAKFISDLGPREGIGRRYGFFFAANSVSGTLIGILASSIVAKYDGVVAMRWVYYIYAGLNIIVGLLIWILYKPSEDVAIESADDRFQFKYALQVLKNPAIWLVGIMGFGSYMAGKVMVYAQPFMKDIFQTPLSVVTLINAFTSNGVVVLLGPISGWLTDKLRSATRVVSYMLIGFGLTLFGLLVIPWETKLFPFVVTFVLLVSASRAIAQANWVTPATEVKVPKQVKGTAIGIASVLMFSSDSFAYNVFGRMVDKYGDLSYKYIFGSVLVVVVISFIASIILRKKYIKDPAPKAAEETTK